MIVFAVVFGGALFGVLLARLLPEELLSAETKDVIKVAMAMIATLAALVLGLLTASAKSSLDEKENRVRTWAAEVMLLDRTLAAYGPEAQGARDLLKQVLAARVAQLWPGEGARLLTGHVAGRDKRRSGPAQSSRTSATDRRATLAEGLGAEDHGVNDSSALGRGAKARPEHQMAFHRHSRVLARGDLREFRIVRATKRDRHGRAPSGRALSVAGALYLILEMDQPYGGLITISPEPLKESLAQLGKP